MAEGGSAEHMSKSYDLVVSVSGERGPGEGLEEQICEAKAVET